MHGQFHCRANRACIMFSPVAARPDWRLSRAAANENPIGPRLDGPRGADPADRENRITTEMEESLRTGQHIGRRRESCIGPGRGSDAGQTGSASRSGFAGAQPAKS